MHVLHEGNGTNAALNHDICRAADHDEMFDIVPANENEPAARIDGCCIQNLQAGLAIFAAANEGGRSATPANDPQDDCQSQKCRADANDSNDEVVAISADKFVHHGANPFGLLSVK